MLDPKFAKTVPRMFSNLKGTLRIDVQMALKDRELQGVYPFCQSQPLVVKGMADVTAKSTTTRGEHHPLAIMSIETDSWSHWTANLETVNTF